MSEESIARITSIVDALAPIGDATAGEPVRAAEWNVVVGAVVDLARIGLDRERTLSEALAAAYAPRAHEHIGVADLRWFDPDTRTLVETGGSGRPDLEADLKETRRRIDGLGERLQELAEQVDKLARRVDQVLDRDDERREGVDELATRIEGIAEQDRRIAELRTTFAGVDERVGEALALREELAAAGNLAELRERVTALSRLERNLTGADGTLVPIRDIERRIVALETSPGGGDFNPDALRASILAAAGEEIDERTSGLGERLGALGETLDTVRADVEGHGEAIDEATGQLATQGAQLRAVQGLAGTVQELQSQTNVLTNRTAQHQTALRRLDPMAERIGSLEAGLEEVQPLFERVAVVESNINAINVAVGPIPGIQAELAGLAGLASEVTGLTSRVNRALSVGTQVQSSIDSHEARLAAVEGQTDDATRLIGILQTQTQATRETVALLSSDVQRIRTSGGSTPIVGSTTERIVTGDFRFPVP